MKLPRYVNGFVDRHGKARYYFRRAGFKKVSLPGVPWSPCECSTATASRCGSRRLLGWQSFAECRSSMDGCDDLRSEAMAERVTALLDACILFLLHDERILKGRAAGRVCR
jgi:hypothetical protein